MGMGTCSKCRLYDCLGIGNDLTKEVLAGPSSWFLLQASLEPVQGGRVGGRVLPVAGGAHMQVIHFCLPFTCPSRVGKGMRLRL